MWAPCTWYINAETYPPQFINFYWLTEWIWRIEKNFYNWREWICNDADENQASGPALQFLGSHGTHVKEKTVVSLMICKSIKIMQGESTCWQEKSFFPRREASEIHIGDWNRFFKLASCCNSLARIARSKKQSCSKLQRVRKMSVKRWLSVFWKAVGDQFVYTQHGLGEDNCIRRVLSVIVVEMS